MCKKSIVIILHVNFTLLCTVTLGLHRAVVCVNGLRFVICHLVEDVLGMQQVARLCNG